MAPADPSLATLSSPSSTAKCVVNDRLRGNFNGGSSEHARIAGAVSLTSIREAIQREETEAAENNRTGDGDDISRSNRELSTSVSLEQHDNLLFHVSRSYNRLSLKSRNKKRKVQPSFLSSVVNSIENVEAFKRPRVNESDGLLVGEKFGAVIMNGHKDGKHLEFRFASSSSGLGSLQGGKSSSPPVASLSNLGNTCFLNSVLYTLRFTPGFLHSLHHLVYDLGLQGNAGSNGKKRSGSGMSGNGSGGIADADTELVHDVVDQLHDLFKNMSCIDESPESSREPIPPNSFLQAVGKLNPMFEGNQQQDAHELLVTVLNTLQDIKIPVPRPSIGHCASHDAGDFGKDDSSSLRKVKKKTGKSIFYSGGNQQPSHSLHTSSALSNGLRSSTSRLDQIQISNGVTPSNVNLPDGQDAYLPNFVKDNFVGKSLMGTRCLECEASTYRSETFTNIDIPLTFDDQDEPDSESVKDLFLKQIMASETLRENNKYWCSKCLRLNEAQRSVQYEILPRVMVLQLKRFTATGNKSYTSKINEYIPTPFTMNCFCTQCMPNGTCSQRAGADLPSSRHHYKLYAVIMHLGATLASGHYTAYVRAGEQTMEYMQCNRSNSVERKNKAGKGIMKYFSRSSDQRSNNSTLAANQTSGLNSAGGHNGVTTTTTNDSVTCRSVHCCAVRTSSQLTLQDSIASSTSMGSVGSSSLTSVNGAAQSTQVLRRSLDSVDSGRTSSECCNSQDGDEMWLECDDETIHVISRRQFEEDLNCNRGFTTPYLLFYQRV